MGWTEKPHPRRHGWRPQAHPSKSASQRQRAMQLHGITGTQDQRRKIRPACDKGKEGLIRNTTQPHTPTANAEGR
eukprot:4981856-Prorocentrum_lima.AAC.1